MDSARLTGHAQGVPATLPDMFSRLASGLSLIEGAAALQSSPDAPPLPAQQWDHLATLSADWMAWAVLHGVRLNPLDARNEQQPSWSLATVIVVCATLQVHHLQQQRRRRNGELGARDAAWWRGVRRQLNVPWRRSKQLLQQQDGHEDAVEEPLPWMLFDACGPARWPASMCVPALQLMAEETVRFGLSTLLSEDVLPHRRALRCELRSRLGRLVSAVSTKRELDDEAWRIDVEDTRTLPGPHRGRAAAGDGPQRASPALRFVVAAFELDRMRQWQFSLQVDGPSTKRWTRHQMARDVAGRLRTLVRTQAVQMGHGVQQGEEEDDGDDALRWLGRRMRRLLRLWLNPELGASAELLCKSGWNRYNLAALTWADRKYSKFMVPLLKSSPDALLVRKRPGLNAECDRWVAQGMDQAQWDTWLHPTQRGDGAPGDQHAGPCAAGWRAGLWHMFTVMLGPGEGKPHAAAQSCHISAHQSLKRAGDVLQCREVPLLQEVAGSWALWWYGRVLCPGELTQATGGVRVHVDEYEMLGLWFTLALEAGDALLLAGDAGEAVACTHTHSCETDKGAMLQPMRGAVGIDQQPVEASAVRLAFEGFPGAPWRGYHPLLDGA